MDVLAVPRRDVRGWIAVRSRHGDETDGDEADARSPPARRRLASAWVPRLHRDRMVAEGDTAEDVGVQGREVLRRLVEAQFRLRGLRVATEPVIGADGVERTHVRPRERGLQTIFGEVRLERLCHGQRGVDSLSVVDAELSLPTELYSLGLRRLVALEAAKVLFDEVVAAVSNRSVCRVVTTKTSRRYHAPRRFDARRR